jgi:hypothetical protein
MLVRGGWPATSHGRPGAYVSATCDDYPNQAVAQSAGDTADSDGDGIYCESLPVHVLEPGKQRQLGHRRRRVLTPSTGLR